MLKKLIINADDYGMTPAISQGIIYGIKKGIITSTTAMMNTPYIEEDLPLLKSLSVGVGVHLNITYGKPLTHCPSLMENGLFKKVNQYDHTINKEELYHEWEAQIQRFIQLYGLPDHLDSHHYMHTKYLDVFEKLHEAYPFPYRQDFYIEEPFFPLCTDFHKNVSKELLLSILNQDKSQIELMCHPGFLDLEVYNHSSYHIDRMSELAILCDPNIKQYIDNHSILLTNYQKEKDGR